MGNCHFIWIKKSNIGNFLWFHLIVLTIWDSSCSNLKYDVLYIQKCLQGTEQNIAESHMKVLSKLLAWCNVIYKDKRGILFEIKLRALSLKSQRGEGLATKRETPKEDQTFSSTEIKLLQTPQILPVFWDEFTAIQLTRDWCVTPSIPAYPFEGTTVTVTRLGSLGQLPMACASGCEGIWGVRWAPKRLKGA